MSIAPHTILRPFGVNPVGRYLGRHAGFSIRSSSAEAVNWEKKQESSKRMRKEKKAEESGLEVLYEDGFGTVTIKDYLEVVRDMPKGDGGPPRWFCPVECGRPVVDKAPLLRFLPGTDGVGMELILHHKSLGMVFEVRCLHIPVSDRTPFGGLLQIVDETIKYEHALSPKRPIFLIGLLQIVDETIKYEHALSPKRPIFLIGDSLGGCLSISVASLNTNIDLVLILINPGMMFAKTPDQAILPLLELMPRNLAVTHPLLLRYLIGEIGEALKNTTVSMKNDPSLQEALQKFPESINSMLTLTTVSCLLLRRSLVVPPPPLQ